MAQKKPIDYLQDAINIAGSMNKLSQLADIGQSTVVTYMNNPERGIHPDIATKIEKAVDGRVFKENLVFGSDARV